MTAVASPPTFTQHNRPAWGINGGHAGQMNPMNTDELNRMFLPRKNLQRNNSSSSISSTSSVSSTSTIATTGSQTNGNPMPNSGDVGAWSNGTGTRKRPQPKAPWPSPKPDGQSDFVRMSAGRPQMATSLNGSAPMHSPSQILPSQSMITTQQAMSRPMVESLPAGNQPALYLLSLNGTFERKTISVPFSPETLRIGRQTNAKTVPTPINGFFDSKVLSRQHAEIWADRQGKIWIRDVKSSNGTFVNGSRLSQENRESEPHELQTGDHLELGIDIVSEDQKTVVHHKVAAKVEHAGFLNPSSNLLDMNFGDLDPANGSMMMMGQGGIAVRPRPGSQASMASNGRVVAGNGMMGSQGNVLVHQRGLFYSPISTEQIVKRLQNEMRTQRLQSEDLGRTNQFVHKLLSKEDIKDFEKPEVAEPPKSQIINGNGISFRSDNKTRFSDPPAPPPQQPLPEKPDVPSLKRGITERPKQQGNQNVSPIRQDGNSSQILQLTEALNSAKREIENQSSRMRDLEETLQKERQARELAEELARRLEEAAAMKTNGTTTKAEAQETALEAAFEPPVEDVTISIVDTAASDIEKTAPQAEAVEASATHLQAQIESMIIEMKELRQQLDDYKQRAKDAEAERDADRKSLAEMALQIREAEAREAAREKALAESHAIEKSDALKSTSRELSALAKASSSLSKEQSAFDEPTDQPTLSRANTITPHSTTPTLLPRDQALANSIPYASMIGVVLIGWGLMAYINGWEPQPRLER
ncbi:hypothetical protein F5Y04DRAFT_226686 [Hypomontagnella monticulosa]|nr:hypothetical protein F5Y04DRAFT_226686 [Hypomontagnella monticulosa]